MTRNNKKLTKKIVDEAICPAERDQIILWDSELLCFGVRISHSRKTYLVQTRVGGKSVRVTIGRHGPFTADQARIQAKKVLADMARGINPNQFKKDCAAKGVTLQEAFETYIASRKLSETTLRDYHKALRIGFPDWVDKPLLALTRTLIEARFHALSEKSPAQANQMFRFLRALLNFAKEKYATQEGEPLFPSNPCDRLTALKVWHAIPKRTRYLEPHQIKPWFEALDRLEHDTDHTIKDYCIFVLLTGCREQEAAQLKWADVDLRSGTVSFLQTKNHKKHMLPLGSWLKALLLKRHAEAGSSEYVFPANNKFGHLKNHAKSIKRICELSGVEFTLHDLRRTFATVVNHQLSRSFSLYTIKRLLNHSDGDVTAGYIQFGIEDLRDPMQLIEIFVLKSAGISEISDIFTIQKNALETK